MALTHFWPEASYYRGILAATGLELVIGHKSKTGHLSDKDVIDILLCNIKILFGN